MKAMNSIMGIKPDGLIGLLLANGFQDAQSQHPSFMVLARPEDEEGDAIVIPVNENTPHFFDLMASACTKALRHLTQGYNEGAIRT